MRNFPHWNEIRGRTTLPRATTGGGQSPRFLANSVLERVCFDPSSKIASAIGLCNIVEALGDWQQKVLIGADILMIISGLIGAFLEGQEKYYFWGFGMVMFMPILYYLNALKGPSGTTLSKISLLTIVGWSAYPIVWLVAEGHRAPSPATRRPWHTPFLTSSASLFSATSSSPPVTLPPPSAATTSSYGDGLCFKQVAPGIGRVCIVVRSRN